MTAAFQDHFSGVAAEYARFRPGYPQPLFDWLAAQCARHDCAWDCATGSGQAAVPLAARYARVIATDASAEQIARAPAHPGIEYRVATAEASGLPEACADLVTVAQALHWFEHDAFWREVSRVLRPGGVVAAWTYGRCVPDDEPVRAIIRRWYAEVTGPYWPPSRVHVDSGYRTIRFPFAEFDGPVLEVRARFTLAGLVGYAGTWSATVRMREALGRDPLPDLAAELAPVWGDPDLPRAMRWPLAMRAGRSA